MAIDWGSTLLASKALFLLWNVSLKNRQTLKDVVEVGQSENVYDFILPP